ncbi:hypothetical protein GTP58_09270 [Duganella sp. CY15W]|uniref:RHS repeat-associated core domain-containing protein n=1 Tax=Duganella sp. CY15W TaxID=2692172 RepID=UPI00136D3C7B|nr:RHS repeat-associated core domain-containing protein [Duganella sp. CY15W]MYM28511.1 hypothetical protein [Duganella sp. CY15W]
MSHQVRFNSFKNFNMTAIRHLVGALALLTLCGGADAQSVIPADPSSFSRSSAFEYDPDNGMLLSETVEPNNPALCVKTVYTYDAYGNRKTATQKNCDGATGTAVFAARTTSTEYAATTAAAGDNLNVTVPAGGFATKVSNPLNQSEARMMDARYGSPVLVTGPNLLATNWQIDDFGRTYKEVHADATAKITLYCYLAGRVSDTSANNFNCPHPSAAEIPADAVAFVYSVSVLSANDHQNGPVSMVYLDAAGRKIRSVVQAFDGSGQTTSKDRLIVQDTIYNNLGGVAFSTQPYFLDSGASSSAGTQSVGINATVYDELGRPIDTYVSDPKGLFGVAQFGPWGGKQASHNHLTYQGMKTVTTDDQGKKETVEKNVDGKIGIVTNALGAQLAHVYDAFGNLLNIKDGLQNTVVISYDIRGRKRSMTDPDAGTWQYEYNAAGDLISQQNPNQAAKSAIEEKFTKMEYDLLGRMIKRVEPEYTTNWYYDTYADGTACNKGAGKLCETKASNGVRRRLFYDNVGRPVSTRVDVANGPSFVNAIKFDATTGRPSTQIYPTGLSVNYNYTTKGYLNSLTLSQPATVNPLPAVAGGAPGPSVSLPLGSLLWQALSYDAWGHLEQQIYGNNVVAKSTYNDLTGRVDSVTAGIGDDTSVANYKYEWDSLNRLRVRTDGAGANVVTNNYDYDEVGRLHNYSVTSSAISTQDQVRSITLQYNAVGALLYKTDVGTYSYRTQGGTQPHAVQSIAGAVTASYTYDANGNMITGSGGAYSKIDYTSFNLPDSQGGITGAAGLPRYTWQYDESHQRIKETRTLGGETRVTWMLHPDNTNGLAFESEENAGVISNRHYLATPAGAIGVLMSTGNLPTLSDLDVTPVVLSNLTLNKVEYWHKDMQNSVLSTTDHTGTMTQSFAYDPFGKRRFVDGNYDADGKVVVDWNRTNKGMDRGYTGHEHLDDVGIINMNGRIYDPRLGMFMQTDPYIQDPTNLQNLNRYGYCFNNPMTCTDPSGRFSLFGHKILPGLFNNRNARIVAAIAAASVLGPGGLAWGEFGVLGALTENAVAQAAIAGFVSGSIASGNLRGGLQGAVSAVAFFGAGEFIQNTPGLGTAGGIAVHAVVGCATSEAGGGNCGSGALSAGFSKALAPYTDSVTQGDRLLGPVVSAVVGGTASVLGGGKFANGAQSAAFSYLFNWLSHVHDSVTREGAQKAGMSRDEAKALGNLVVEVDKLNDDGSLGSIFNADSQNVPHSYMHSMCASGNTQPQCVAAVAEYIEKSFAMNSLQGLAQVLHAEQDYLSPGHQMRTYNGHVGLDHIIDDALPGKLRPVLINNTKATIIEYDNRCGGCILKH